MNRLSRLARAASVRPVSMYLALTCTVLAPAGTLLAVQDFAAQRSDMVREIEADTGITSPWTGQAKMDARVLEAMGKVPRHEFVPPDQKPYAYENRPLPIGHGQTISQPYIVALMTDLMRVDKDSVVLEIGTGSGYQAAVLSALCKSVYTIEIIEPLGRQADERLQRLNYHNVQVRIADGYYGWEAHAPFDAIIVTAAASHIPPPLVRQLKPGGRMVIPVGASFLTQQLLLVEKGKDGSVRTRQMLPVAFVPLTGEHPDR
jgi:protein-L-isoaspartate(D-aspartate) O-methyltransferase